MFSIYYFLGSDNIYDDCSRFLASSLLLYGFNNYMIEGMVWEKRKIHVSKDYFQKCFFNGLLIIVLVNVLIKMFPYNKKPVSFKFINEIINSRNIGRNLQEKNIDELYKNSFNISYTGFGQNPKKLGGAIKTSNSEALKIYSQSPVRFIYLRGTIKDSYNSYMWYKSNSKLKGYKDNIDVPELNMSYEETRLKITPKGVLTTSIFNSLYPAYVRGKWDKVYKDTDMEVYSPFPARLNDEYEIMYKEYKINKYYLLSSTSYFKTNQNNEEIRRYMQLPEDIPRRVYDLTYSIVKNYSGEYKRVFAIENYLKKNYTYSKDTSVLPNNRDFVDYFLFTEKKGYCTYYASAMTIMCRMAGIPARYIEGFLVDGNKRKDGYFKVLNSDAHAWVEVYFNNVGWVTLDPTPGNNFIDYELSDSTFTASDFKGQSTMEDHVIGKNNIVNKKIKEVESDKSKKYAGVFDKVFLFILIIVACILFINVLYVLIKRELYKKNRFLKYAFFRIAILGKIMGISYYGSYTIREYIKKIQEKVSLNLEQLIEAFERANYSNASSDEDINIIRLNLKEMEKLIGNTYGKSKVYIYNLKYLYVYIIRMILEQN